MKKPSPFAVSMTLCAIIWIGAMIYVVVNWGA